MLTIFTPTYNRAYTLSKLYNSLLEQTNKDFEWLIVDDGSTDDTESLVSMFCAENKIVIRYLKQENGGKHRAINRGVKEANGRLFFIVDSDDSLPVNAVERILYYTKQIEDNPSFAGVSGNRIFPDLAVVGGNVSYSTLDTDAVSIREKYGVKGDMAEVYKTVILQEYPFPEIDDEKFLSEGLIWSRIAMKYKLRYFNEGIYTCEYLQDGLTNSIRKHHRNSPKGTMLLYKNQMCNNQFGFRTHIRAAINYWRYTINIPFKERDSSLRPAWWSFLFYPLGWFFYKLDLSKEKK